MPPPVQPKSEKKPARRAAPIPAVVSLPENVTGGPPALKQLTLDLQRLPRYRARPFRTELTVEENSLFVANNYKGDFFVRESVVQHPETGEDVIRRITVGKSHGSTRSRGVLRQMHQDAFYKVLQLWGAQGYPLGEVDGKLFGIVRTSMYELVQNIFPGNDNVRSYRRARDLLRDLQGVPILTEYVQPAGSKGSSDRDEFTLLNQANFSERQVDETGRPKPGGKSLAVIMLSSMVTEGFLARRFKVLLGQPYDSLGKGGCGRRGEIARLLYPFLDARLSSAPFFEAPLDALSARFGLNRYAHRSKRKEKFAPALRALEGTPILEEKYTLRVQLIAAPDDYILRAERVACG